MPSVFETATAASAIPITFATKATWDAVCAELPHEARQFALANGFTARPGACLTLPAADGKIAQAFARGTRAEDAELRLERVGDAFCVKKRSGETLPFGAELLFFHIDELFPET